MDSAYILDVLGKVALGALFAVGDLTWPGQLCGNPRRRTTWNIQCIRGPETRAIDASQATETQPR